MPGILGRVPDAAAEFSSSAALPVLTEACRQTGLSSDGAELLRIGENAIFRLASAPMVVRIARSADRLPRVKRELCVARWLAAAQVPAVLVADEINQPLMVDGHPVSFWHAVTGGDPTPTHVDLARLLAAYHAAPDCPCDLDIFEPLATSASRLAKAEGVDAGDRDFLQARCADLAAQFEHLEFALPRGPIHGDAHTRNLLTDHGQVVLIDFEAAAIGPREWDLLPTSIAVQRYGLPEERYQQFAAAYGFDVRSWPGYPVLREIRELTMTTWIMQNVRESPAVAAEFALRVASCGREMVSVPGISSDQPRYGLAHEAPDAAEPSVQRRVRLTNMYATPWRMADSAASGDLQDYLRLWRFEQYYRLSADQLPGVLWREALDVSVLKFQRWRHAATVTGARVWLFRLPSGQIVAVLSLDANCELIDAIDLLEDCYFGDVQIGEQSAAEYAYVLAARLGADCGSQRGFLPECHQMVLGGPQPAEESEDLLQRLVYRADLPYRKEYSAIRYPAELNRRPGWLAAVGPYVSVVCGHSDFIENAVFLSAVQAVAAAAQLRAIRQAAYADVRLFRDQEAAPGTTRDRRRTLERIADQLGDLELELSYSVEASADLGLLVPSLRVESFHDALYDSMDMAGKAATAGRMLQRLSAAISAELTAIESAERRADENRRSATPWRWVSCPRWPSGQLAAGVPEHQRPPGQRELVHV